MYNIAQISNSLIPTASYEGNYETNSLIGRRAVPRCLWVIRRQLLEANLVFRPPEVSDVTKNSQNVYLYKRLWQLSTGVASATIRWEDIGVRQKIFFLTTKCAFSMFHAAGDIQFCKEHRNTERRSSVFLEPAGTRGQNPFPEAATFLTSKLNKIPIALLLVSYLRG